MFFDFNKITTSKDFDAIFTLGSTGALQGINADQVTDSQDIEACLESVGVTDEDNDITSVWAVDSTDGERLAVWVGTSSNPWAVDQFIELVYNVDFWSDALPAHIVNAISYYFEETLVWGNTVFTLGQGYNEDFSITAVVDIKPINRLPCELGAFTSRPQEHQEKGLMVLPAPKWAQHLGEYYITGIRYDEAGSLDEAKELLAKAHENLARLREYYNDDWQYASLSIKIIVSTGTITRERGTYTLDKIESDYLGDAVETGLKDAWGQVGGWTFLANIRPARSV